MIFKDIGFRVADEICYYLLFVVNLDFRLIIYLIKVMIKVKVKVKVIINWKRWNRYMVDSYSF